MSRSYSLVKTVPFFVVALFISSVSAWGGVIEITAGTDAISAALAGASSGDTLALVTDGGVYRESATVVIDKPLTIRAAAGLEEKPVWVCDDPIRIIELGDDLALQGISFDGSLGASSTANGIIPGDSADVKWDYKLKIDNCDFSNFDASAIFFEETRTEADTVLITNSFFTNIVDEAINFKDPEKVNHPAPGSVKYFFIENCTFWNIASEAFYIEAHDDDLTTPGPVIIANHLTVVHAGSKALYPKFCDGAVIKNSIVAYSKTDEYACMIYGVNSVVEYFLYYDCPKGIGLEMGASYDTAKVLEEVDPMFADPDNGNFALLPGSPCIGTASDGSNMGDTKWGVKQPTAPVTFIADDTADTLYAPGYLIKGSWNANLEYDSEWGGGVLYWALHDDGTHGDITAGDHIWSITLDMVCDYGANSWRWGVCNPDSGWLGSGPGFTLPDTTPQTVIWYAPAANAQVTFNFHDVYGTVVSTAQAGQEPYITIPGQFNGWNPLADTLELISDSIYSITFTNLSVGHTYEYKYYINGEWSLVQRENRSFTVTDLVMVVDDYPIDTWPSVCLVYNGSEWKYNDSGEDLGTDWIAPDYDDSGWESGYAQFGHGDGDETTETDDISTCTYFRIQFQANASIIGNLYLTTLYDDGFVAYLNGTEIDRGNMPEGTITFDTYASGGVENAMKFVTPVDKSLLVNGTNVLATSSHNKDSNPAGDISFDQALSYTLIPMVSDTLIAWGEIWRFNDSGEDLSNLWVASDYDDSGWSTGTAPLGFGNDEVVDTTAHIGTVTYFRKTFNVPDASIYQTLSWDVWKDDGAVVYLNGTEVFRANMPTGTITYDTYALGSEHSHATIDAGIDLLVDGENVVAVSLHNRDNDPNGDRSLDLLLVGKKVAIGVESPLDNSGICCLLQNHPNPFNGLTMISYQLNRKSKISLKIYDICGRLVRSLIEQEEIPGYHEICWDGKDAFGKNVGSGIYFYRLEAGDYVKIKKMLLLR